MHRSIWLYARGLTSLVVLSFALIFILLFFSRWHKFVRQSEGESKTALLFCLPPSCPFKCPNLGCPENLPHLFSRGTEEGFERSRESATSRTYSFPANNEMNARELPTVLTVPQSRW